MAPIPNPFVFREYDIRGVADRDLDDAFAYALGRALGTFWARHGREGPGRVRRVAVGRDGRLSSPRLHAALVEGILETGFSIVDLGLVPTPLLYFTVFLEDLDGGVQVTGSHNPPEDNGFKILHGKDTLSGDEIAELRRSIERDDFVSGPRGRIESLDPLPAYLGFVRGNVRLERTDVRFAIDAGHGAGGPAALAAMRAVGLDPVPLLCEPDGRFPVHHPDPTQPQNLALLIETVQERGLDLGIAFDGDADRIGVIDGRGEILWGDRLMILFTRDVLRRRPGAAILGEVKCSQTLYDDIARRGGRPILWKTGHSLIKKKMKEEGALLAGEMSGHVFFADRYYGFDDAIYASLRLLEIVAAADRPLHALLDDLPRTHATPEIRVACSDEAKFAIVDRIRAHYRGTHHVVEVDGARIDFGDGAWGLVRASNTQPVLVMRFEAPTLERLRQIREEVEALVERAQQGQGPMGEGHPS
jgi:phosphomannomutase/phosphoglucomutase